MPLPNNNIQTSSCTHLFSEDIIQTLVGMGIGYECHSPYTWLVAPAPVVQGAHVVGGHVVAVAAEVACGLASGES